MRRNIFQLCVSGEKHQIFFPKEIPLIKQQTNLSFQALDNRDINFVIPHSHTSSKRPISASHNTALTQFPPPPPPQSLTITTETFLS